MIINILNLFYLFFINIFIKKNLEFFKIFFNFLIILLVNF